MTPIVKSLPSYIKDSNHALEIFRNFNFSGENKIIFTMDITSLYTVILNNEGLQALKYFFNQRPIKKPSSETLLRLAELALTLNCFSFGDNYYKQINGVAMGTKMGPSYAKDVTNTGNGERGTGNREQESGNKCTAATLLREFKMAVKTEEKARRETIWVKVSVPWLCPQMASTFL